MKKMLVTAFVVATTLLFTAGVVFAAETDIVLGKVPAITGQDPINGECPPADVLTDGNHNWGGGETPENMWFGSNTGKDTDAGCDVKMTWDLEKTYEISKYIVWSGPDWKQDDAFDVNAKTESAKDWKLQVSSDGENWTDADVVTGNLNVRAEKTLENPVQGRYVRVWFTKKAEKQEGFAGDFWPALRLSDISIYGAEAAANTEAANTESDTTADANGSTNDSSTNSSTTDTGNAESAKTETNPVTGDSSMVLYAGLAVLGLCSMIQAKKSRA